MPKATLKSDLALWVCIPRLLPMKPGFYRLVYLLMCTWKNSVSSTVLFLISTCHPQNVRCGHLINKSKLAPSCHQITFLAKENATYALRVTSMFTQITLNTTMFIHYLLLMLIFLVTPMSNLSLWVCIHNFL